MLVAARCPSVGEPSPAHYLGHDFPQGPPHRHPQGAHLRNAQEAAVIAQPLEWETDWKPLGASMQFSNWFIHLLGRSLLHPATR